MGEDEIVVEYSDDKYAKAKTLSQAFLRKGLRVRFKKVNGKGVLLFRINKLFYSESDYSYLVARLVNSDQQRERR